jgi:hypothetical protein
MVVRDGREIAASPEMSVGIGDAVRTDLGTALLLRSDGGLLWIGERSQVRLDERPQVRLGEVSWDAPGPYVLEGPEFRVEVNGGRGRLRWYPGRGGEIDVFAGEATWVHGDDRAVLGVGAAIALDAAGTSSPRAADPEAAARIDEALMPPPPAGTRAPLRDPGRFAARLGAGIAVAAGAAWMSPSFELRGRLGGPLWIDGGAALLIRDGAELAGVTAVLALPVHGGVRLQGELPRAVTLRGGIDGMALIGAACQEFNPCQRSTLAEPGVRLALGLGLWMARGVGLELDLSFGLHRRTLPPYLATGAPIREPSPWFSLQVGLSFGR